MGRRQFFAIEFPEDIRMQIAAAGEMLAARAVRGRWTRPENLHLTLQFVGDCPDEWLPGMKDLQNEAASRCRPFTITLAGCGTFGRQQDILWIGVEHKPELWRLANDLANLLRQHHLPYESRPYSPHITIGRQVKMTPDALNNWSWPPVSFQVNQISLMESTRIEDRLTYIPVCRIQF